jgi:hypothetical protein
MSLADYVGGYFSPGRYPVTVKGMRFFTANSGTPGVEFKVSDGRKEGKVAFWLSEKALKVLAGFAESCGITVEQMRTIDPDREGSFRVFVGKRFMAIVEKGEAGQDGKRYSEIVDWEAIPCAPLPGLPSSAPSPAPAARPPSWQAPQPDDDEPPMVDEASIPPASNDPLPDVGDIPF